MSVTYHAPGHGVWDLRLSELGARPGVYLLDVYDTAAMIRSGPFPLRFPSGRYALHWLDSLILPGSRTPNDEREALDELAESFIAARGRSEIWGPICNALFHSDHQGPFLAAPWWYGTEPPSLDHHPLSRAEESGNLDICQLFMDLSTSQVVGIRRQIGEDNEADEDVVLEWLVDGSFEKEMPPHLGHGRQFKIMTFDADYLASLTVLLERQLSLPDSAEWLLNMSPQSQTRASESPIGFREMVGRLINHLKPELSDLDAHASVDSAAVWLSGKESQTAERLLGTLVSLLVAQQEVTGIGMDSHDPTNLAD